MQSDFEMLAGEMMTQQLKALRVLAEDQSSIPAPTSRGRQTPVSPDPRDTTHLMTLVVTHTRVNIHTTDTHFYA